MARVKGWPPAILTKVPPADVRRGDGPLVKEFIEALCPQVKDSIGGRAGEPLILRGWQSKLLDQLFARRADGRLRHRTALVGLPRKNGKSALGSGIGLYGLMMGPAGGEVYSCAADRDQARIVFGMARAMVEKSPELAESTKVYRDAIEVPATSSVYRVLSSEAFTKEGLSPTLVIYDELHAAPNDELWNVMSLAQAARLDALVLGITTAGVKSDSTGQDSTCYRLFQYGSRIAAGEVDDPSFFMAWWQAKDDADHRDPASWKTANPGFGDLQDPEDFDSAVKRTPENEFRTKRMNQWVNAQTAWLPTGAWEKLPKQEPPDASVPVVLFVDGSFSGDSTFIAGCTVEETPRIFKVAAWEKQPEDTDEWRVDIAEVEATVLEACKRFNVVEVPFDPFRWQRSMQALADAGLPIVEYPTSSPARMVPSCAKFYDAVMSGGIAHDHDPQLARHISQAAVKVDRLGPRIVKESRNSPRKIDGAVCAVGAFDRATSYREAAVPAAPQFFA
jgi:phage terminase large subunit-like protein